MCSPTFVLVVAGLTGLAVASVTGSDPQGWLAGLLAGAVAWLALRRSGRGVGSCELPAAEDPTAEPPRAEPPRRGRTTPG